MFEYRTYLSGHIIAELFRIDEKFGFTPDVLEQLRPAVDLETKTDGSEGGYLAEVVDTKVVRDFGELWIMCNDEERIVFVFLQREYFEDRFGANAVEFSEVKNLPVITDP